MRKGDALRKIQILGTGCPKCKALGIEAQIEKVEEIQDIMKFGVMITPVLVVDGQVKSAGKVLSESEIEALLK